MQNVREAVLRELVEAVPGTTARVVGLRGGFALVFKSGAAERMLAGTRGNVRIFAKLDTACDFLRDRLNFSFFEVDASKLERVRLRKARPDRAEALRKAAPRRAA